MKVILQRDIPKVGKGGDIVNVADGYARNYLFPRAYAVAASGGALKEHTARAERDKARSASRLQSAQAEAEKLGGLMLTIVGRVSKGSTKLYGSITAQDVADAVAKETGVAIDKRRVGLADPIKSLGNYQVPVRLHNDVTVTVTVTILTEEERDRRAEQATALAAAEAAARAAAQTQEESAVSAEADEEAHEVEPSPAGETADGAE